MNSTIKEMYDKGKDLGWANARIAEYIGVSDSSLFYWIKGTRTPTKKSLAKVQKALDKIKRGEYKESSEEIKTSVVYRKLPGYLKTETKKMYQLIQRVEAEFGSISNCPNTHPLMQKLHNYLGVEAENDDFDKEKVEKLRIERRLQKKELSEDLGYAKSWYHDFQGDKVFTIEYAEMLADYFEVSVEEFEFDEGDK